MGTEVMRLHDCLSGVRQHAHAHAQAHAHAHASNKRSPRPAARPAARRGGARRGQQAAAAAAVPMPREVLVKVVAAAADAYAGPAFGAMSPSPRALPLPRFSSRAAAATVDDSATRELRRLLGLERSTTN